MIKPLNLYRFVFAIMIFFHHYYIPGVGTFEAGGTCAVSFFFILSGFVLSYNYSTKIEQKTFCYLKYLYRRCIRIFPIHWLCLFIWLCINFANISRDDGFTLLLNSLLLQSWIPEKSVYFSGNALSWFLSALLFFYIVYPLIERVIQKMRFRFIIVGFIIYIVFYYLAIFYVPINYYHALFYINPLFRLFDFVLGVLLYQIIRRYRNHSFIKILSKNDIRLQSLIELLAILLLVFTCFLYRYIPEPIRFSALYWIPMTFLIISCVKPINGKFNEVFSWNFFYKLGNISFTFYMCHLIVIQTQIALLVPTIVGQLLLCLCITLLFSYLVHKYYEQPIITFLQKNR